MGIFNSARWMSAARQPFVALLFAAMVSLTCGLFIQAAAVAIGVAIALLTAAGVAWPWIALRGIRCRVRFATRRGCEGQRVPVTITITNAWPWPVWGLTLQDGFGPSSDDLEAISPAVAVARVGGWSKSEFAWGFCPACRGEYPLERPSIATSFPFGLWQSRRASEVENRVLIGPRSFAIRTLSQSQGCDHSDGAFSEFREGDLGDVLGTRPYRRGDSLRRIHWAQTARHDTLVVSERQAASRPAAQIIVDADAEVHRGNGEGSSLQWTLRIAASLCRSYAKRRASVRCLLGRKMLHVSSEGADMDLALDAMARVPLAGFAAGSLPAGQLGNRAAPCFQEIVITTDVGLQRWQSLTAQGRRRFVVLRAGAFAQTGGQDECRRAAPDRTCVRIEGSQDVPREFLGQWEAVLT